MTQLIGVAEDDDWDRPLTALQVAHYNDLLRRQRDRTEREAEAARERSRAIFGTCLLQLKKLGMREGHARSMLGKWRGSAKDDALLIRVVRTAYDSNVADPASYITKAIAAAQQRTAATVSLQTAEWTLLGWETPRIVGGQARFKHGRRGQVWRDPFGKLSVLPTPDRETPPSLDQDPGFKMDQAA